MKFAGKVRLPPLALTARLIVTDLLEDSNRPDCVG
jgi:hypothetical protein